MKKILSIMLIGSLVFAFSGCDKEKSKTSYDGIEVQEGFYFDEDGVVHVDTEKLDYTAGKNIVWSFDEETETLSFEGKGEISEIKNYAPYKSFAKKIVIGEGITSIVDSAFDGFSTVEEITFAPSVEYIGEYAFRGCMIEELNLPVRLSHIGKKAFSDCTLLYTVNIPKNDTLFDIPDGVFKNCAQLQIVSVPPNITYIAPNAFNNCPNVEIYGEKNSFAYDYAMTENLNFQSKSF